MENSNLSISPTSIVNILTLRYDSSIKPNLPKKTWKDFQPINQEISLEFIEKSLLDDISKKLDSSKVKKLCIALSGGVDSTLILSLIRKINPDIEINAISIKF